MESTDLDPNLISRPLDPFFFDLEQPDYRHAGPELTKVAEYLRSSAAELKVKPGIWNGKRVDYFKGKHAVNALNRAPYKKISGVPAVEGRSQGEVLLTKMHFAGFFVKIERGAKLQVQISQQQAFHPDEYYIWLYEGPQWKGLALGTGVLALVFAGVLFPLWPETLRTGVYYLSLGVLGLMGVFFGMTIVRLLIWLVTLLVLGQGGLLFPNLFEDVSVIDSFIPVWG
ncbi:translocation protein Sec62-domain-containing protein [Polychytrium aggregatum]|uniref:translocation protein Sec62-domain-containing protein n=1 Tax=Polychytrium aggregatum TaxID=110093 RepID=UPI0022FF279D|nr:translocation protein Sec62-domain-containing protein [Polychytrium aggregatum]KAI9193579.1 translocation protein Sec62-domain-containing protein [Polychytrium aggregatum]